MALPVVDLPQPDSPTNPRVSPGRASRLTSETAWTFLPVRPKGNSTTMSSTRSSADSVSRRWASPLPAISAPSSGRGGLRLGGGLSTLTALDLQVLLGTHREPAAVEVVGI